MSVTWEELKDLCGVMGVPDEADIRLIELRDVDEIGDVEVDYDRETNAVTILTA